MRVAASFIFCIFFKFFARDDAKAEPTLASRFALAVTQSFAKRRHCIADQADRCHANVHIQRSTSSVRKRHRPDTAL